MTGGYIIIDLGGIDFSESDTQTVSGLTDRLNAAAATGKPVLFVNACNDDESVLPFFGKVTEDGNGHVIDTGVIIMTVSDDDVTVTSALDDVATQSDIADMATQSDIADMATQSDITAVMADLSAGNAGAHNAIFRGKDLGTSITAAQWSAISEGTFDDLFIGDYWTLNDSVYRIAAFDYWLNKGDTACTDHHAVIVPDVALVWGETMNSTDIATGAYVGSEMYTTHLADVISMIETDIGTDHILTHRELFAKTITGEYESNWSWYDSAVDLMSERQVYGCDVYHNFIRGENPAKMGGIDNSQFPLFSMAPQFISPSSRVGWWLRDVATSTSFAFVHNQGFSSYNAASGSYGVRPCFGIIA